MSRTSRVMAMAKTPSLKASSRPVLNPRRRGRDVTSGCSDGGSSVVIDRL
jgi:hypothetical protein